MKKYKLSTILLLAILLGIQATGFTQIGTNGVGLPEPDDCINCDDCTKTDSKVASTLGISTQATDSAAFASGKQAWATGQFTTAIGHYVKATGDNSMIFGFGDYQNQSFLQNTFDNTIMFGVGATTSYLTIRNDGTYDGIGIGTSTPLADLDVNGTIRTNNLKLDLSTQANYVLRSDAAGNATTWTDPKTLGIWQLNSSDTYFSSGNVAIGKTSPATALDVNGTISTTGFKLAGATENYLLTADAAGNTQWTAPRWESNGQDRLVSREITGVNIPTGTDVLGSFQIGSELTFWGNGVSDNKVIGNNYKWDSGAKRINDGAVSMIGFNDANGTITFTAAESALQNSTISGKKMAFTANGRLGIGHDAPDHELDVRGYNDVVALVKSYNNNTTSIWTANTTGNFGFATDQSGIGHIYNDINNPNEIISFFSDGRVLIGNNAANFTHDDHKLYVDGSIETTGVKIAEVSYWSDFVFDPDYNLPTLGEVESHIETHGHLPGVPSEKEVYEEGINLAETDAMLLQKIEELTLYILEQDKKIKALEHRLDANTEGN